MQENYKFALKQLLIAEGGWSDDPRDPGGATMYGIIQVEYNAWRRLHGLIQQSVRKIAMPEVEEIYALQYASPLHFSELPSGVDYCVFDYGVNSGVSRSAKELQRVVKTTVDGFIGINTLAATRNANAIVVINSICNRRLAFLQSLSTFSAFGKGWTARVARVRNDSFKLATGVKLT